MRDEPVDVESDSSLLHGEILPDLDREGDTVTSTWRVLLDARVRAEETVTSLRQNLMLTAIVVLLGVLILERMLFFGRPNRLLLFLLAPLMLAAGAAIDLLVYGRRVRMLEGAIVRLEAEHPQREHLESARENTEGRTFSRVGVAAYYGIPLVAVLVIAAWRFL